MSETGEGKVRLGPIRRSETCPTDPPPVQTQGVGTGLSGGSELPLLVGSAVDIVVEMSEMRSGRRE